MATESNSIWESISKIIRSCFNNDFLKNTFIVAGTIGIVCLILYCTTKGEGRLALLGILMLIGAAAFMSGFFTGFLFGIPKVNSNTKTTSQYLLNNNLIEISDWLTKIIVGLGLMELKEIPEKVESVGIFVQRHMAASLVTAPNSIVVTVNATIVFFAVFGVYYGYNYMRLFLSNEYVIADKKLLEEKQEKESVANAAIDFLTDSYNSTDTGLLEKIDGSQKALNATPLTQTELTALLDKAKLKMKNGLAAQATLPEEQKDPNKNQWGGKSENNGRKVSATIVPVDDSDLFRVVITVSAVDTNAPLQPGKVVLFSLHQTFPDPYKLALVKAGEAKLEVISYGAFTVGVLAEDGSTELELDLTTIAGAPDKFIKS